MTLNGIEVQARREALGLSQHELARYLAVNQVNISRWESGKTRVPDWYEERLLELEGRYLNLYNRMADAAETMLESGEDPVVLIVHRGDESYGIAHPEGDGFPAVLQRVAAARIRMEMANSDIEVRLVPFGD